MMKPTKPLAGEQVIEIWISNLLRIGVLLSAFVVLLGGIFYLIKFGHQVPHYKTFRGEPEYLRSVIGIVHGAFALNSQCIMQLGLLLLIATPVCRVLFSVFAFALEKDWLYVSITLVVLSLLSYSLLGSH